MPHLFWVLAMEVVSYGLSFRPTVNFRLQDLQTASGRLPNVIVFREPFRIVWLDPQYGHVGFLPRFIDVTSFTETGPGAL